MLGWLMLLFGTLGRLGMLGRDAGLLTLGRAMDLDPPENPPPRNPPPPPPRNPPPPPRR
jgi:hypothetical protein